MSFLRQEASWSWIPSQATPPPACCEGAVPSKFCAGGVGEGVLMEGEFNRKAGEFVVPLGSPLKWLPLFPGVVAGNFRVNLGLPASVSKMVSIQLRRTMRLSVALLLVAF